MTRRSSGCEDKAVQLLRVACILLHPEVATCFVSTVQFFDVVDADHSGEIDVHELQRALALGDLNFSLSIVAHMIRRAYIISFLVSQAGPLCDTFTVAPMHHCGLHACDALYLRPR